jgi:hypothetical protein
MSTLIVTVTQVQTTDWDDNPLTIKQATSTIDGVDTTIVTTDPVTSTDQEVIDEHEAQLTSLGYTWDN